MLRRTPWFPVWWFDDLVARGYLIDERADSPERQGRYRLILTLTLTLTLT